MGDIDPSRDDLVQSLSFGRPDIITYYGQTQGLDHRRIITLFRIYHDPW